MKKLYMRDELTLHESRRPALESRFSNPIHSRTRAKSLAKKTAHLIDPAFVPKNKAIKPRSNATIAHHSALSKSFLRDVPLSPIGG